MLGDSMVTTTMTLPRNSKNSLTIVYNLKRILISNRRLVSSVEFSIRWPQTQALITPA